MNPGDPLLDNANEYWRIIENLRVSNERLEKEVKRLHGIQPANPIHPKYSQNNHCTHIERDTIFSVGGFCLIINQMNKPIYADKNALKLWDVTSPAMWCKFYK